MVEVMKTMFLSWEAFEPQQLRVIEVGSKEVTLIYENESRLALEFSDEDQAERFLNGLVGSLMHPEPPDEVRWN